MCSSIFVFKGIVYDVAQYEPIYMVWVNCSAKNRSDRKVFIDYLIQQQVRLRVGRRRETKLSSNYPHTTG